MVQIREQHYVMVGKNVGNKVDLHEGSEADLSCPVAENKQHDNDADVGRNDSSAMTGLE